MGILKLENALFVTRYRYGTPPVSLHDTPVTVLQTFSGGVFPSFEGL